MSVIFTHLHRCSSKYDFAGSAMVTDVVKYEELMETMHVLHFHEEELGQLHTLLMALLTLGNIDFVSEVPDDPDAECLLRSSAPLLQFGMLCGTVTGAVWYSEWGCVGSCGIHPLFRFMS